MNEVVLDASAVLAYLQAEPGAERVEALLLDEACHLLTVNLAEVLTRLADWHVPLDEAESRIAGMELTLVAFDRDLAKRAAALRPATRALGLSLGDRACLALAGARDAVAVTADRNWLAADLGVKIECIRPGTGAGYPPSR